MRWISVWTVAVLVAAASDGTEARGKDGGSIVTWGTTVWGLAAR